ncbi:putative short chain dehydrogenase/reductase [Xylogone sp. PMI_703]|nr:putative short chain dehydrogenase/reductase [Xylogone sp. PMI_703]
MSSPQRIVLITGANQGIGYETAKNLVLSSSDWHVIIGSRDPVKGANAVSALKSLPIKGTVSAVKLDVTSEASVEAAATIVAQLHGRLDVLVNNAGIFSKNLNSTDCLRENFAVNCIGVVSVTEAFLPLLRKSSSPRLIFVSTSVGSLTLASDPRSKYYSSAANEYRASKAALNMLMVQYWVKLGPEGFKVFGADPGLIATNLIDADQVRKRGAAEPQVGGDRIVRVIRGERDADVGKVSGEYGISPW